MPPISFPLLAVFVLADVTTSVIGAKSYVIRTTSSGRVRGYAEKFLDKDVNVFLGVPFAQPPVGELRFKAPKLPLKWEHVLDVTNLPASCFQAIDTEFDRFKGVDMWNPNTELSEDCLYLNVWEPAASTNSSKRAVMVWIYGGGLYSGTSTLELYDGRILAAVGDVVVVSMQYRIGALGFLYLGTPEAPGNQGLLDQNLALRWVRENIVHFGGDPSRVTVFGESAGAFSVNLHLLSPLSKDIVRSGIMQSASASAPWGFDMPDLAKAKAKNFAKQLGCAKKKELDVVKCLQQIKAADLVAVQQNVGNPDAAIVAAFVATIDNHFLTEHPVKTLERGNFKQESVLMGVNRDEGFYFLAYLEPDYLGTKNITKKITPVVYRSTVNGILGLPAGQASTVAETAAFEYGAPYHGKNSMQYRKPLDDIMGDTAFKCPVVDVALWYAKDRRVSVYVYEFNHRTSGNPWPNWMGVMHGYEIDHVFGLPVSNKNYTSAEKALSQKMIGYWTNFAKTGNPNGNENAETSVKWPTYQTEDRSYLLFESGQIRAEQGLRERQCQFWRDLVPQIRKAAREEVGSSTSEQYPPSYVFQVSAIIISTLLIMLGA